MTDRAPASSWLHYQTAETSVMLSPAVTHRSEPHWSRHAVSALTRPELGLLPNGVRYVLALDDSLRLECVAADSSRPAPGQHDARTPAGDLLAAYETERQVWLEATQADGTAQALAHGVEADDLDSEADEAEPASSEHWAALREVAESMTTDALLAESFRTDPSAPWGLFMFADEEFVTVEVDRDHAFLRFDRALTLPLTDPQQALPLIEWLLRINTMSVIGPRASLQIEADTELPLISLVLPRQSLDAPTIRDAITELDARARSIEAQWLRLASPVTEPSSIAVSNTWLRG